MHRDAGAAILMRHCADREVRPVVQKHGDGRQQADWEERYEHRRDRGQDEDRKDEDDPQQNGHLRAVAVALARPKDEVVLALFGHRESR